MRTSTRGVTRIVVELSRWPGIESRVFQHPARAMRLILASQSPRRRELLRRIVSEFEVIPGDVDETLEDGPVADAVTGLALRKARAVAGRARVGVVLAADTVVVIDGMVLGKPVGSDEARGMLVRLRG